MSEDTKYGLLGLSIIVAYIIAHFADKYNWKVKDMF